MVTINVHFENSNKFYFEGEKVCVKLEVCVDQPINVASILANFVGACNCRSDCRDKGKIKSQFEVKIEKEIYFDEIIPIFVAVEKERSEFSKRIHLYSLEYQLPPTLPTSIESSQGSVRYTLYVSADVGGNIVTSANHFTVVSKVDLNNYVTTNLPAVLWRHENECVLSFLCLRNGPVRAFLHILKKGYVPGEFLTMNAEVRNFNRLPVNWVKACIVQILKYHCSKKSKRKRIVAEITRGCIMPYESQIWRSENMFIPAIPPSTFPPKRMINVKYKLYFLIKTSWQEKTISLKQKLVIGAVPLMERKQTEERGQGEGEGMVNNDCYHYSNLEPCIFGPHSIKDENSVNSFSPLYPMYSDICNI